MPEVQGFKNPDWPADYVPRVIVKFPDQRILLEADDPSKYDFQINGLVETFLQDLKTGDQWKKFTNKFPQITTIEPAITSVAPSQMRDQLQVATKRTPDYLPPNFLTYFAIPCPPPVDPRAVVSFLRQWGAVELAYIESGPSRPPAVNPGDDLPGWSRWETDFLDPAPRGIDAVYAWTIPGGDGSSLAAANGLQLVDIEQGWIIPTDPVPDASPPIPAIPYYHDDLNPPNLQAKIQLIHGANRDWFGHGTAVLGIIRAVDNNLGTIGIVPNIATTMVASIWPTIGAKSTNVASAIWAANSKLNFGDVLLLEVQSPFVLGSYRKSPDDWYRYVPIEIEELVFQAIRACTNKGIVVVEAAGNGGLDLDDFVPDAESYPTWGQDSGAIIVGAGASPGDPTKAAPVPAPRSLVVGTNCSRSLIHCFAWGEDIYTTGNGVQGYGKQDYVPGFGGTSGASAIIAGAALAVQGVCQKNPNLNRRLDPLDKPGVPGLRSIFKDPTRTVPADPLTGNTLSARSTYVPANPAQWNADKIGVMPNLKAIIDRLVNVTPPSTPTGLRVQ